MSPLASYRVQRVEPGGVNLEPPSSQLVVWGIREAHGTEVGIKVGATVLLREQGETVEALRLRAMRDVVPGLPADALRDRNGKAVGHFIYPGLGEDHCAVTPERLEGR